MSNISGYIYLFAYLLSAVAIIAFALDEFIPESERPEIGNWLVKKYRAFLAWVVGAPK